MKFWLLGGVDDDVFHYISSHVSDMILQPQEKSWAG